MMRFRRRARTAEMEAADEQNPYVAMEENLTTQPLGTTAPAVRAPPQRGLGFFGKLTAAFSQLLRGHDGGAAGASRRRSDRAQIAVDRARWQSERRRLEDECVALRAEAQRLGGLVQGWEALLRDGVFYVGLHNRAAEMTERFSDQLRASLAEVEGVSEVEITELRLPSAPEHAPQLSLIKYCGPELSEWRVRWSPSSTQAGASITLRGRKFGVTFTVVIAVGQLHFDGQLQCCCTAEHQQPVLQVGFKRLPELSFEIGLAGKALSLGSDTLRAWLKRQVDRWLRATIVMPQMITIDLPAPPTAPSDSAPKASLRPSSASQVPHGTSSSGDVTHGVDDAPLHSLLALRSAGSSGPRWSLSKALADTLGVPLSLLRSEQPSEAQSEEEWATTLVIALLQLRYHDRASIWASEVELARNATPPNLMRAAMEVVCQMELSLGQARTL